jgi:hypothetical protein
LLFTMKQWGICWFDHDGISHLWDIWSWRHPQFRKVGKFFSNFVFIFMCLPCVTRVLTHTLFLSQVRTGDVLCNKAHLRFTGHLSQGPGSLKSSMHYSLDYVISTHTDKS